MFDLFLAVLKKKNCLWLNFSEKQVRLDGCQYVPRRRATWKKISAKVLQKVRKKKKARTDDRLVNDQ